MSQATPLDAEATSVSGVRVLMDQGCNRGVGGRGTGKARSAWAIGIVGTQSDHGVPPTSEL